MQIKVQIKQFCQKARVSENYVNTERNKVCAKIMVTLKEENSCRTYLALKNHPVFHCY